MRTYRDLIRAPEFRPIFLTSAVQVAAQTVSGLALGTLIYLATGSALLSALGMFGPSLAQLIGATTFLSAADRLPPRATMTTSCVAFGLGTAALALPGLPVWSDFAIVMTLGLVASLGGGVSYGLLNEILPGAVTCSATRCSTCASASCRSAGSRSVASRDHPVTARHAAWPAAAMYLARAVVARFGLSPRPRGPSVGRRSATPGGIMRGCGLRPGAPLCLSRAVGARRAHRRLRVPLRGLCAPARWAALRLRRTRDAGWGYPGRAVRPASVAGMARCPAAPAARRSVLIFVLHPALPLAVAAVALASSAIRLLSCSSSA